MFPNKRIKENYQLCEKVLNFSHMSWWIIDLEDDPNVFYCNRKMCDYFSLNPSFTQHSVKKTCPIAGDYNTNVAIRSSKKAKIIFNEYNKLRKGTIDEYRNNFPYFNSSSNVTIYFSSQAKALVKDEFGKPILLVGIIETETVTAELYNKVRTDSLTGLYNRREFDSQINFFINLGKQQKIQVSLLMCDVDNFKQYNDLLGHYEGDECLIKIAKSISNVCAQSSMIACRYGGEEFSVLVYGSDNSVSVLANKIRQEVRVMGINHPGQNNSPVTLSIGYYSIVPDRESSPRKLIECADKALYNAKNSGRDTCMEFIE